jgi:hypothetical protein
MRLTAVLSILLAGCVAGCATGAQPAQDVTTTECHRVLGIGNPIVCTTTTRHEAAKCP